MKAIKILVFLGALTQVSPLSLWFDIFFDGRISQSMAVGGPNYQYIIHGASWSGTKQYFTDVCVIDWGAGTFTKVKTRDIDDPAGISGVSRLVADGTNFLLVAKTVISGFMAPENTQVTTYPLTDGAYYYPEKAMGTSYVFFGGPNQVDGVDKLFRVLINTAIDIKTYSIGSRTLSYGVFSGTTLVMASEDSTTLRKIFDYTKGFDGSPSTGAVATHHKKPGADPERVFVSPGDARGYYVLSTNGAVVRGIATYKESDGSQKLQIALTGLARHTELLAWVPDTDLVVGAHFTDKFFIVDFMGETPASPVYETYPDSYQKSRSCYVWEDKKVLAIHAGSGQRTYLYKLLQEMPCSDLCLTCDGIWRKKCLTCQPNSSISEDGGSSCFCNPNYYEAKKSYSTKQCLRCHSPLCKKCSSGASDACLSCLSVAEVVDSGVCRSCDSFDSPECPAEVKIEIIGGEAELARNFTIKFTPALNTSLPTDFQLSAELLTTQHLSLNFKRKEENEAPLTILNQTLTHQQNSSLLFIEFLEKMRAENTEHIKIAVKDPWLFRTQPEDSVQKVVFFKKTDYLIGIKKIEEVVQERDLKQEDQIAQVSRATVGVAASFSILFSAIFGTGGSALTTLKFFNILEVISNISKLNIQFGPKILVVTDFIGKLNFPEIEFLTRLSPIKDSKIDDPDVNAYLIKPRGSRGKMTTSNSEIYLASGKNFIISCTIISLWALLQLLSLFLKKRSIFRRLVAELYQILFGMVFFDYQLICINEISMFDYSTLRKTNSKFTFSLFLSFLFISLILSEFYEGFKLLKYKAPLIQEDDPEMKNLDISKNQKLILKKNTEGIKPSSKGGQQNYFIWIANLRFFVIQLVIGPLQLLNRTQALLALIVNFCFFIYFWRLVLRESVFQSEFIFVKYIVQESSIMVFIATITLFSFTENSKFSSSTTFKVIEVFTILSLIGAAGAECLAMVANMYLDMTQCCRKKKKIVMYAKSAITMDKAVGTSDALIEVSGIKREARNPLDADFAQSRTIWGLNKKPMSKNSKTRKELAKAKESKTRLTNDWPGDDKDLFGEEGERISLREGGRESSIRGPTRLRQVGIPVRKRFKKHYPNTRKHIVTKSKLWDFEELNKD